MSGSTLPLAPDAFSGRKLGKYEVLCRLSTGGMAEIFLASQRGLAGFRKLVVLKQILPDIAGQEEFVEMFLDEAKVTAAFNHPHIAQVFDLDVADGELFLAMEFVPGATLVEVAKACRAANEPIPMGLSLETVRDTALALHYAHTFKDPLGRPNPVIHRDVAEKNIMVTYEGVTKLLDFGIAKSLARRSRTQVGMVKGTTGYMSPEQILGEPLDSRSDLFSLGVVLHECLTGLRLFHSKTPEAGAGMVLQGQVPPPSRTNKAIPPELDAIVLKALARKREDRYATTLEFARALERAVGPLIWHPEQSGELIARLFSERRVQTQQLLLAGGALSGEATGQINLSALYAAPPPVPVPVPPAQEPVLPPSPPPPPPPAPEAAVARPPTPPRGALRRPTSAGLPAVAPEAAVARRAVFEPLPQKRAGAPAPSELPPPPPPPPPPAAWEDANATRTAQPDEEATSIESSEEADDYTPAVKSSPVRARSTSSERVPSSLNTSGHRRRRAPMAAPAKDEPEVEFTTQPVRLLPLVSEPEENTHEDEAPSLTTSPTLAVPPPRKRGGLMLGLAVGSLLLVVSALALGVDGGRVSGMLGLGPAAPVQRPGRLEPLKPLPKPASAPASAPNLAPAPAAPAPAAPAPAAPAPAVAVAKPPVAQPPAPTVAAVAPPPQAVEPESAPPEKSRPAAKKSRKETKSPAELEAERAWGDPAPAATPAPVSPGGGVLTLVTTPYAKVYLGKRYLGDTPLFKVNLPAGKHSLRLVSAEGQSLKLPVEIKSGETTALKLALDSLEEG